jgi:hypothetical protein
MIYRFVIVGAKGGRTASCLLPATAALHPVAEIGAELARPARQHRVRQP